MMKGQKCVTVSLDVDKVRQLDQIASKYDRSRSWLLRRLIDLAVEIEIEIGNGQRARTMADRAD